MRQAADEARRGAQETREGKSGNAVRVITSNDNGALKTTRIDLNKAQIVYNDAQGEMKIETIDNKKVLTAKDPQGRLLFSGPVESNEELAKMPPEVRQRYEKLEQKDIPAVIPRLSEEDRDEDADEMDVEDNDDSDDDEDNDSDAAVQEVSAEKMQRFPSRRLGINTVLI